ncbi:hypothetical protein TorRG33x02_031170 [Trema orientale]|uniref:Uncharacterized protein n=1 Tax=Trema orientale TaxID=63057 RepID=A0A2P5FT30_TREOI|nr:hypothetical protein TorRG33x02_031170 [Trema orientale]
MKKVMPLRLKPSLFFQCTLRISMASPTIPRATRGGVVPTTAVAAVPLSSASTPIALARRIPSK